MADIDLICRNIYHAAWIATVRGFSGAPVAYIHLKTGKNSSVDKKELTKAFDKVKWDTPLSTADLSFEEDSSVSEDILIVEDIEEFQDDEGNAAKFKVHPEDSVIKIS